MKKGQIQIYVPVIAVFILIIFLAVPLFSVNKISFSLKDGNIQNPRFVESKETGASFILNSFKSKEISSTKLDILIYNKTQEECLRRNNQQNCQPVLNESIWAVPTTDIELTINLANGEYISRIISFVYNQNYKEMREKDKEDFSFVIEDD